MSPNPQQWFKFDLALFDEWIPKMSPEAGILFCVMVRKMAAWNKTTDTISVSQLMTASGMKESRVHRALKALSESGCPLRKIGQNSDGSVYSFDPSGTPVAGDTLGVSDLAPLSPVEPLGVSDLAPTTDVITSLCREYVSTLSLEGKTETEILGTETLGEEVVARMPTDTSKPFEAEDGLVEKTNSEEVDLAPVVLGGPPTRKVLFVDPKTGRTWETGQEVACLSSRLKIPIGEAKDLLGLGLDFASIRAIVHDPRTWELLKGANSRTAYLRGILINKSKGKANNQAEPTSTPIPSSAAPLPVEKQAPAAPKAAAKPGVTAQVDAQVRDAIHALGNRKYTVDQIGEQVVKAGGLNRYDRLNLMKYLVSMHGRGLVHITKDAMGVGWYASLEAVRKPAAPVVIPVEPAEQEIAA